MLRGAVPLLVRVAVCTGLGVLTRWVPKVRLAGAKVTAGAMPVPARDIDCGLSAASSVMVTVAVRALAAVGVKVRLRTQLAPAASVAPLMQVVPEASAKSPALAPPSTAVAMLRGAVPFFVRIRLPPRSALLPCSALIRSLAGAKVTAGAMPVPASDTDCGLPAASSATLRLALLAPVDAGWNFSPTLQLAPAARVVWVRQSVPIVGTARTRPLALVPVNAMLENVSGPVPALLNCTFDTALALPTATLPKARLAGLNMPVGAGRWKTVVPPTPLKAESMKK